MVKIYHFDESNKSEVVEKFVCSSIVFTLGLHPHSMKQNEQSNNGVTSSSAMKTLQESQLDEKLDTAKISEPKNRRNGKCLWKVYAVILDRIFCAAHFIIMTLVSVYYYIQLSF